jgi:hypothetical protein
LLLSFAAPIAGFLATFSASVSIFEFPLLFIVAKVHFIGVIHLFVVLVRGIYESQGESNYKILPKRASTAGIASRGTTYRNLFPYFE